MRFTAGALGRPLMGPRVARGAAHSRRIRYDLSRPLDTRPSHGPICIRIADAGALTCALPLPQPHSGAR